jgi:hypothetical protein
MRNQEAYPMKSRYHRTAAKLIVITGLLCLVPAAAIDLIPGEVIAPVADTKFFLLSYQLSERGDNFKNNTRFISGSKIETQQLQMRAGASFDINNFPAFFYAQLPVGTIEPSGTLSNKVGDSGIGDTSFLLAIWPYSNRDTGEYLGVAGYLTLPTGSYEPRRTFLNMGANRTTSALQIGYQRSVMRNLEWMAALDGIWFGKNDDYSIAHATLRQKNLYNVQTGLRYVIDDRYSLAATHFYSQGGETNINGVDSNDPTALQRWQITGAAIFDFGRVTVQYGRDLSTKNGFIETSRMIIRYGVRF